MNFQDLLTKMKQIDECGMAPMPPQAEGQQDSVNMNVTMSGSGAGGIRDLLAVLKDIENGPDAVSGGDEIVIGEPEEITDETFANEPNEEVAGVDAVTPTGNDLHSKGDEAEKANGGGNPWKQTEVSESLKNQLTKHYEEVKSR